MYVLCGVHEQPSSVRPNQAPFFFFSLDLISPLASSITVDWMAAVTPNQTDVADAADGLVDAAVAADAEVVAVDDDDAEVRRPSPRPFALAFAVHLKEREREYFECRRFEGPLNRVGASDN